MAPVDLPSAAGASGLITPVLSVGPVAMAALLAPVPSLPESELVAAMPGWVVVDGLTALVELLFGAVIEDCASAMPEQTMPSPSVAAIRMRDICFAPDFVVVQKKLSSRAAVYR